MKKLSARIAKMEGRALPKGPEMIVGSSQEEIDKKIAEVSLKYSGYQPPLVVFIRKFSKMGCGK